MNAPAAVGLLEVRGLVAAIEGADAAAKAAEVRLLGRELVADGIVTVTVTGRVADVLAAVEAGAAAADRVGTVLSAHVIPSPGGEVRRLVEPRPRTTGTRSGAASRRAALEGMTVPQLRSLALAQGGLSRGEIGRSRKAHLIELMLARAAATDEDGEGGDG